MLGGLVMYFLDLTPYEYFKGRPSALNIGWLDAKHPFISGDVPHGLVERLRRLASKPSEQTRGFHYCELCNITTKVVLHDEAARKRLFDVGAIGSAEIRVVGKGGMVYAAPTMVWHYVSMHKYQPPQEFIDAVMNMNMA
jgi:hypothetical protein